MSFPPIWSGNFHHIRSYVGSSCSFRILNYHAAFLPGKQFDPRMCYLRPSTTEIVGRNQKWYNSEACDINRKVPDGTFKKMINVEKKPAFHKYRPAKPYSIQNISEEKLFDRPATVLVFDTETTGFSREWERIIEIAIRDLLGGKNSTFQTLINPGRAVANTECHGISSDMVSGPGVPSFKELIPILLQFVSSRQRSGSPVLWIAHNARVFDVPFLIREFKRCSVKIPDDWIFIDQLFLARQLRNPDGSKLSSHSLEALRKHYRIPLVGSAHRAMQDVDTLTSVFQCVTYELKLTIPELMQIAFRPADIVSPRSRKTSRYR
ncbi:hypothetical protein KSP40_PGU016641 [Platanthera guangdongensis]|uniref:Exonuclease domain-containing protein n=1 Tax=Platanthera guangdongensis TaxID=2320717 RepID=A0ABR2MEY6_9ASPA